jgi:hypothetical protein
LKDSAYCLFHDPRPEIASRKNPNHDLTIGDQIKVVQQAIRQVRSSRADPLRKAAELRALIGLLNELKIVNTEHMATAPESLEDRLKKWKENQG